MAYKYNPFSAKFDYYEPSEDLLLVGSGAPSDTLGSDGDFYMDVDTLDIYQKVGGTWL